LNAVVSAACPSRNFSPFHAVCPDGVARGARTGLSPGTRGIIRAPTHRVIGSPADISTWTPTFGAVPSNGGAQFMVWAPEKRGVDVVFEQPGFRVTRALNRTANGCFSGWVPDVPAGALYRFRLDGDEEYPDPASRFQPEGVHGPSMFVDPTA